MSKYISTRAFRETLGRPFGNTGTGTGTGTINTNTGTNSTGTDKDETLLLIDNDIKNTVCEMNSLRDEFACTDAKITRLENALAQQNETLHQIMYLLKLATSPEDELPAITLAEEKRLADKKEYELNLDLVNDNKTNTVNNNDPVEERELIVVDEESCTDNEDDIDEDEEVVIVNDEDEEEEELIVNDDEDEDDL